MNKSTLLPPTLSIRSSFPLYPVYGRDADVLRAGQLLFWQVPPWFSAAWPTDLQPQNRQLPHCILCTRAGELQVGFCIIHLFNNFFHLVLLAWRLLCCNPTNICKQDSWDKVTVSYFHSFQWSPSLNNFYNIHLQIPSNGISSLVFHFWLLVASEESIVYGRIPAERFLQHSFESIFFIA